MKNLLNYLIITPLLIVVFTFNACTPKTGDTISDNDKTHKETTQDEIEKTEGVTQTQVKEYVAEDAVTDKAVEEVDISIPVDPDIRIGYLSNGLKYYIRKNEKPENRAELRLAVNAGSIQEDEDQLGLAHFVEHMGFNGSTHFEKSELVDYLESIGTRFGPDLNAYTSFDETVYMLQARTDSVELLLKGLLVLEDWAGGVAFEDEEIDKERGVVISEWRSGLSPDQRMRNEYLPVMYKDSRYAQRLPIGKPEIVENASYQTVKRFYKDWYRPNLMAVVLIGDFDVDDMEKQVRERFSKLKNPPNERTRESYPVPSHQETLISINSDKEASFTNIQLTYKHPKFKVKTMEDYRQSIVHRLYNSMLNARLNELAQSADPPFTFAYTGYSSDLGDKDSYSSFAMVPEGGALNGLEVIVEENERVLKYGFIEAEMDRQKTELLTSMENAFKEKDKTESRRFASRYIYNYLKDVPIPSIDSELKFYQLLLPTIQLDEVNSLAAKWITDENRVVVITGPEKPDVPMPNEAEVKAVLDAVKQKEILQYVDNVSDEPFMKVIPLPIAITDEKTIDEVNIVELNLENGAKVILKPTTFKNDEILLYAYREGGTSLYSDEDYPSASNAASIVNASGLSNFDLTQLQKKLTGKTLRLRPYISEQYEGFSGSSSPDDLETFLQMLYLYCTAPRKDEIAFQSYISKQKSIYKNLMSNPNYWFSDQVSKIQFNNHIRRGFGSEEDLDKINLDRAFEIYKERFADAGNFTFCFVGNFEVAAIKPLLVSYLGNLPTNNKQETMKDVGADYIPGKIQKTLIKGKAPKALINMNFHGDFDWNAKNRYDFNSMIAVLRIKMRESMREDKGGVYGVRVSGYASKFPKPKYSITISFNADPPMVDELVETALQDIKNAKEIGAEEKDLTKVKETQRQGRTKDLKENRFWNRQLPTIYKYGDSPVGLTLDSYEKYIIALSSDDIKNAANKYFDDNNFIKIIMLPEEEPEN